MLIKDYYTIEAIREEEDIKYFDVALNPECEVYKGHFPGDPISPGVCNIQMIKECAEHAAGKSLTISNVLQCRFISLVTPVEVPKATIKVKLDESDGKYILNSSLFSGETEYMSFKAELIG